MVERFQRKTAAAGGAHRHGCRAEQTGGQVGRSSSGRLIWRTLAAMVGLAVALGGFPDVAGAAAIGTGTPDGSGNYAACSVNLAARSDTITNETQAGMYPFGDGGWAYVQHYSVNLYCNTAFGSAHDYELMVWIGDTNPSHPYGGATFHVEGAYPPGGSTTVSADGHVQAGCTVNLGACGDKGAPRPGGLGCYTDPLYATHDYSVAGSGGQSIYDGSRCTGGVHCAVKDTSGYYGIGSGWQPCATSSSFGGGTADEPGDYWGAQSVSIPTVAAPVVTCSMALNPNTGQASFTATSSTPASSSIATGWQFGDGTTGTGTNVVHTYSTASMPPGGWSAVFTSTATGDGVGAGGTSASTCTKVADVLNAPGAGAGGSADTSTGGTAPPTSCGWLDVVCNLKVSIAWLFVPTNGFYSAWSGFLTTLKTAVPFCYVAGIVSWCSNFVSGIHEVSQGGGISGAGCVVPSSLGIASRPSASGCAGDAGPLGTAVYFVTTGGFLATIAFGLYRAVRRTIGQH